MDTRRGADSRHAQSPGFKLTLKMKIQVKTTGILDDYLPRNSNNPAEIDVGEDITPMDVVRHLGMPADDKYLIAVNGDVVPRSEHAVFKLSERDTLAIMPPLKGG